MRRFCYLICILFICNFMGACKSKIGTNELDTNASPPTQMFPSQGLPSNYVHNLDWSVDSQILFFKVDSGFWSYDISAEKIEELQTNKPEGQTVSEKETPLSDPLSDILDEFDVMTVSPSGRTALVYQTSTVSTPVEDGNPYFVDIWIWEEGNLRTSGTIEVCGLNHYIWTEDEKFVGIQSPLAPAKCNQSSAWLVDLSQNETFSILPVDIYHANSTLHSFSPNSDNLLIKFNSSDERGPVSSLQIYDLETQEVSQLTTPVQTDPVDWFSNNKLLVLYKEQILDEVRKLAFLEIQSNQLIDLIDPSDPTTLNGQFIAEASLSPDKKWIAFTVENQRYETSSLWLMQLDLEK